MLYLFMSLWIIFGVLFVSLSIYYLVKRKLGRLALGSLCVSVVCLIAGIFVNGQNAPIASAEQEDTNRPNETKLIVDASQFGLTSESDLVTLLGDAESVDEWEFSSPNGQKYKAKTYSYDGDSKEFMVIDSKVVRFTFNGHGETFNSHKDVFNSFGIKLNPGFAVKEQNEVTVRYQNVSEGIEEFWLITDGASKIETVKITYDLKYFK